MKEKVFEILKVNNLSNLVDSVVVSEDSISIILGESFLRSKFNKDFPHIKGKIELLLAEKFGKLKINIILVSNKVSKSKKLRIEDVENVILIMSGKGGVGKSSMTVLLAYLAKYFGFSAGILDADIYGPSIPLMMGLSDMPSLKNGKMLPLVKDNISTMSIGYVVPDEKAAIWRGPMLSKALNNMILQTDWSQSNASDDKKLDYLFVDMPPGTGDIPLQFFEKFLVDGVFLVSTPQKVALADMKKAHEMCSKMSIEVMGLIENWSYFVNESGGEEYLYGKSLLDEFCKGSNIDKFCKIPFVPMLREMLDDGGVNFDELIDSKFGESILDMGKKFFN